MTQPPHQVPIRPYAPVGGYSVPARPAPAPPVAYPYPYPYPPPVAIPPVATPPVATAPSGAPLAEFSERLVAYLLDTLIMTAFLLVPYVIGAIILIRRFLDQLTIAAQTGTTLDLTGFLVPYLIFIMSALVLQAVIRFCYEVLYQSRAGQTVGKRVMKIRIDQLDGQPLSFAVALRRWLVGAALPMVVPFFTWLDGLWQLWDKPYRQCLHDKVAKTVVVKANAGARTAAS